MATNDQSMATLTEDWIVTQIKAIQVDEESPLVFEDVEVAAWEGSLQENARDTANELLSGKRTPIARVRYRRDTVVPLEGGEQKHEAMYEVFVGVKNDRPRAARRGDGTVLGTNVMRDLLYGALHNKCPAVAAHGRHTDRTRWGGSEVAYNTKTEAILYAVLHVDEVRASG